jgi:hypothetical protein
LQGSEAPAESALAEGAELIQEHDGLRVQPALGCPKLLNFEKRKRRRSARRGT